MQRFALRLLGVTIRSIQGPGDTESKGEEPAPDPERAAARRAQDAGPVVPGAAAHHTTGTVAGTPHAPVVRGSPVAVVPAVLRPLEHVAQHVVKTKRVRLEQAHQRRPNVAVRTGHELRSIPVRVFRPGLGGLSMATEKCTLLAIEKCTLSGSSREGSEATGAGAPG